MKIEILLLLMCFGEFFLNAQDFSTKFYLTDKHGTKDSLELGYSSTATFGIDPQFGEVEYNTPVISSKFTASIIINVSNKMLNEIIRYGKVTSFTRKQIVPNMEGTYIEQNAIGIMIPAESLPVTISWDKSLFIDSQRNKSLITDWTIGGWFDAGGASFLNYLKDTNSIQINDSIANYFYLDCIYFYSDGTNEYPMYIFYVAFANATTIMNGINDLSQENQVSVYPSITSNYVYIRNETAYRIHKSRILTLSGMPLEIINDNSTSIDLSKYPNGIYLLCIETTENISYFKIIKK